MSDPAFRARLGMYRTVDDIWRARQQQDPVLVADAQTSMCDYRLAFSLARGRRNIDRNGYSTARPAHTTEELTDV